MMRYLEMNEVRDRASGWKHAKLSGHENESKLEYLMAVDEATQRHFLERVGKPNKKIIHVDVGGLCETDVPCVFAGEKTKSKTDMHVILDDGTKYNISIKKSLGGQVYLIGIHRFIRGFEAQYKTIIPNIVKRAITLFWGSAEDIPTLIEKYGTRSVYERRKNRLVADTLKVYDISLYDSLLNWFKENIVNIADFCFSRGLAFNESDWANVIWYKNELGENQIDEIYLVSELCNKIKVVADSETFYGKVGGGTTIQLPFGFVQWHSPTKKIPGDMQFHHKYTNLAKWIKGL